MSLGAKILVAAVLLAAYLYVSTADFIIARSAECEAAGLSYSTEGDVCLK